jgi:hypothetical protein
MPDNLLTPEQFKRYQAGKVKKEKAFAPVPTWNKYTSHVKSGRYGFVVLGEDHKYTGKEEQLQKAAASLCDMARLFWFHAANEGKRNPRTIAGQGMKKGVSDCIFMEGSENEVFIGAAIELKAQGGKVDPAQIEFLETAYDKGNFAAICWNLESFEACLRFLWPSKFKRFI